MIYLVIYDVVLLVSIVIVLLKEDSLRIVLNASSD